MNQVVRFNPGAALAIPAHIASYFGEESNIEDRVTVPSLSYEGKVWTVSANGDKKRLTKTDENGDEAPISTMRVVILDYAKRRGRAFYEGTYDPAKPGKPSCWSEDGIAAHASVARDGPMSGVAINGKSWTGKCDGCPLSIKGSKVSTNGKEVVACSQHRMLAIVPAGRLDFTPLRLKLSITSDWDGQSPDLEAKGWFAFSNFTSYLQKKGVSHTAAFITKMNFDPNATWPKVMFTHDRWLTEAELATITPIVKSDEVKSLLAGTWTATGVDGEKIEADPVGTYTEPLTKEKVIPTTPTTRTAPVAAKVAALHTEETTRIAIMDEDDDAPAASKPAVVKTPPKATKAPKATPVAEAPAAAPVAAKTPVSAPVVAPVTTPDLAKLLDKWAMEDE